MTEADIKVPFESLPTMRNPDWMLNIMSQVVRSNRNLKSQRDARTPYYDSFTDTLQYNHDRTFRNDNEEEFHKFGSAYECTVKRYANSDKHVPGLLKRFKFLHGEAVEEVKVNKEPEEALPISYESYASRMPRRQSSSSGNSFNYESFGDELNKRNLLSLSNGSGFQKRLSANGSQHLRGQPQAHAPNSPAAKSFSPLVRQPGVHQNFDAEELINRIVPASKEEMESLPYEMRAKPYSCEICGRRYKNHGGVRYHLLHYNHDDVSITPLKPMGRPPAAAPKFQARPTLNTVPTRSPVVHQKPKVKEKTPEPEPEPEHTHSKVKALMFCDFCLGTDTNKEGQKDDLVSCATCGHSGHMTCLQFDETLARNCRTYPWQCQECKVCLTCSSNQDEDNLLFCDSCDRAAHMYCLTPKIKTPPEGSWFCPVCIKIGLVPS